MGIFGPNIKKMEKNGDIDGLQNALQHHGPKIREKAAFALDRLGWSPPDDTLKAVYLVAKKAWDELVDLGLPAVPMLLQNLEVAEKDFERRFDTAMTHDRKNLDKVSRVDCEVIEQVLGRMGTPVIDPLIQVMKEQDVTGQLRFSKNLGNVLVNIGEPAVDRLIHLLEDETSRVAETAASSLGRIGDQRAIPPLVRLMEDETKGWFPRCQAIWALENFSDQRVVEAFVRALKALNRYVRANAARSLGKLSRPPADDAERVYRLFALMVADAEKLRGLAKQQWDQLIAFGSRAVEPMIQSLQVKDELDLGERSFAYQLSFNVKSSVDLVALQALIEIGEPSVIPLIRTLQEQDGQIRRKAAFALGEIRDPRAKEALLVALEDEDEEVRKAAKKALKRIR
jgi:HEAT repeat protein